MKVQIHICIKNDTKSNRQLAAPSLLGLQTDPCHRIVSPVSWTLPIDSENVFSYNANIEKTFS